MNRPIVSIIVPIFEDATQLKGLLSTISPNSDTEIIVVNGSANDSKVQAVRSHFPKVNWIESFPGRSRQMNYGAAYARGRWFLFLHADVRLDSSWFKEVRRADRSGRYVGGSFRFLLDSPSIAARLIEWGVAARVRCFGWSYGDQALFIRRDIFESLGGYRPWPLMEDVDLMRRLRRAGEVLHSNFPVRVSARRWERDGWIRRTIENILLTLLFLSGVSPERLAHVYYRGAIPALATRSDKRRFSKPLKPSY